MNGSTTEGARGICPIDWHIPTNDDWDTLQAILGDGSTENDKWENGEDENIGTSLKYGKFNAALQLAGYSRTGASWYYRGISVFLWSSVEKDTDDAWRRWLYVTKAGMTRGTNDKAYGYTVRCIKN